MKILVLGGAGYIGSHTVYELTDAGEDVVIIDNLETGYKEAVHPKAKFYQGDRPDRADQYLWRDKALHGKDVQMGGQSTRTPVCITALF